MEESVLFPSGPVPFRHSVGAGPRTLAGVARHRLQRRAPRRTDGPWICAHARVNPRLSGTTKPSIVVPTAQGWAFGRRLPRQKIEETE